MEQSCRSCDVRWIKSIIATDPVSSLVQAAVTTFCSINHSHPLVDPPNIFLLLWREPFGLLIGPHAIATKQMAKILIFQRWLDVKVDGNKSPRQIIVRSFAMKKSILGGVRENKEEESKEKCMHV
jgi:hypothetical protein